MAAKEEFVYIAFIFRRNGRKPFLLFPFSSGYRSSVKMTGFFLHL